MRTENIHLKGLEELTKLVVGFRVLHVVLGPGAVVSLEAEGPDEQRYILRLMGAAVPIEVNGARIVPNVTITVKAERVVGDDAV